MKKVIAVNNKRVSDFIGIEIDNEADLLLELNNEKIKKFITDYSEYLSSNKIEKLKEFYELTGLIITHICNDKEGHGHRNIYSMNNLFREGVMSDLFSKPIYTTHILVISDYDSNGYEYFRKIFEKNMNDVKIGNSIRYTLSCVCSSVESKIERIEKEYDEYAFNNIDKKQVADIYLTPLNNLCILFKNGDLYLDNKLYAKNVHSLWHQDSHNVYIVYKDNKTENLISEFPYTCIHEYNKTVCNSSILATLDDKTLNITVLVDKPDTCVMTTIIGIDDIECDEEILYLIIGNKKVSFPTWYNTIVVSNR